MLDRPYGAALLDVARQALLDEVAPTLQGRSRYTILMVANAMGIASRELEHADRSRRAWDAVLARVEPVEGASREASVDQLVRGIRAGQYDGEPTLHAALMATAEIAAHIWKPGKPA